MWFYLPFQVISALIVLYRVATFNDCKDAAKELQQVMLCKSKILTLILNLLCSQSMVLLPDVLSSTLLIKNWPSVNELS